ncbi:acyl-CoA:lysophosphatidylglycerol acyltransferase 1 [Lampetra planeri]
MALLSYTWLLLKMCLRFGIMVINNLVAIPSYLLYLLALLPLRLCRPRLFWELEGVMFKWLLAIVASWGWVAGYTVVEWGADVAAIAEDQALVMVNHQSTGDICTLMMCLQDKGTTIRHIMWVMEHIFKFTNFGLVSWVHGDFFIKQGKAHREHQVELLRHHLGRVFRPRARRWLVLFPEGGFLRKRRETSQRYATRLGLPALRHVTLPRLGAAHAVLHTLSRPRPAAVATQGATPASSCLNGGAWETPKDGARGDARGATEAGMRWVIDVTIAYPNADPMDIQTWVLGYRPPITTHVHYRLYPVSEVPLEMEALTKWMYQRFIEKEHLLDYFYTTGAFPAQAGETGDAPSRAMVLDPWWLLMCQLWCFLSGYMWFSLLRYICYGFIL